MMKRCISMLLCICMLMSMVNTRVFAAEADAAAPETPEQVRYHCGLEPHTHGAECYCADPLCALTEGEGHAHSEGCYEYKYGLICDNPVNHSHSASCYKQVENLVCTQDHTHTGTCYTYEQKITCPYEEGHFHGSHCRGYANFLTCTRKEQGPHTHGDACYLTCERSQHVHTGECEVNILSDRTESGTVTAQGDFTGLEVAPISQEKLDFVKSSDAAASVGFDIDLAGLQGEAYLALKIDGVDMPFGTTATVTHLLDTASAISESSRRMDVSANLSAFEKELAAASEYDGAAGTHIYVETIEASLDRKTGIVGFPITSCSSFTVDFHYGDVDFSIPGGSSILLSELFDQIGYIEHTADQAVSVEYSTPEQITITQVEGDWLLTSNVPFDTKEQLVIIFSDGYELVLGVTDGSTYYVSKFSHDTPDCGYADNKNKAYVTPGTEVVMTRTHTGNSLQWKISSTANVSDFWYDYHGDRKESLGTDWNGIGVSFETGTTYIHITFSKAGSTYTFYVDTGVWVFGSYTGGNDYAIDIDVRYAVCRFYEAEKFGGAHIVTYDTLEFKDPNVSKKVKDAGLQPDHTAQGYQFTGWSDRVDGINYLDKTVRAQYTPITYKIGYNLNGGTVSGNPTTYNVETASFTLKNPTRANYKFAGWTGTGLSQPTLTVTVPKGSLGDRSYTANWVPLYKYGLNFDKNTTDTVSGMPTNQATDWLENNSHAFSWSGKPTRTGYAFKGWATSAGGTGSDISSYTITGKDAQTTTVTLYADWDPLYHYELKFEKNTTDTVSNMPANQSHGWVESKSHVFSWTSGDPKRDNYTFLGWAATPGGTPQKISSQSMTGTDAQSTSLTLYAVWEAKNATIQYQADKGGQVSLTAETFGADTGVIKGSTAAANNGYRFVNWVDAGGNQVSTSATFVPGSRNPATYTARFTPIVYNLSYDLDGGTLDEANPSSYTVESGTFTLHNPKRDNYQFLGWTGPGVTDPSTTVYIETGSTGDRKYTAHWKELQSTITYTATKGGTVSNPSETVGLATGTLKGSAASAQDGYTFAGWYEGATLVSTAETFVPAAKDAKTYTAKFTVTEYTLTYDLQGGSTTGTVGNPNRYTVESKDIVLNNPTRTDHIFLGWSGTDLDGVTLTVTVPTGSTGNRSYVAHWKANNFTVVYRAQKGGSVSLGQETHGKDTGAAAGSTAIPASGYRFVKWVDADGKEVSTQPTLVPTGREDASYTAVFAPIGYQIGYELEGGSFSDDTYPTTYTVEQQVSLPRPVREHYIFAGWTGPGVATASVDVTIPVGSVGDRVYTAHWTPQYQYSIVFEANADGDPTVKDMPVNATTQWILTDTHTFTWEQVPSRTNYYFRGWSAAPDGEGRLITSYQLDGIQAQNKSVTLYARWELSTYTVSFDANEGMDPPEPIMELIGTDVTIPATVPTREGYDFLYWTENRDGSGKTYAVGDSYSNHTDSTLYAQWQRKTYTVTYDTAGGSGSFPQQTKTHFEPLDLHAAAPAKTGYKFLGWLGSDGKTYAAGDPYTAEADLVLTAQWQTLYKYAFRFDPNAQGVTGTPDDVVSSDWEEPASRTVTWNSDPQRAHYTFAGWSTDPNAATGQMIRSYTLQGVAGSTAAVTLYAIWVENQVEIRYLSADTSMGSVSPAAQTVNVLSGAPSATATAKPGYRFTGWYADAACTQLVGADPVLTVAKTNGAYAAATYYAKFEREIGKLQIIPENLAGPVIVTVTDADGHKATFVVSGSSITVAGLATGEATVTVKAFGWSDSITVSDLTPAILAGQTTQVTVSSSRDGDLFSDTASQTNRNSAG